MFSHQGNFPPSTPRCGAAAVASIEVAAQLQQKPHGRQVATGGGQVQRAGAVRRALPQPGEGLGRPIF